MHIGNTPTLLSRAPIRLNGSFCYAPDDNAGGDAGEDSGKPKEGADKGKAGEPEKLTLTLEELRARVDAALAAHQQKADAKAKKDREAAEAEEAKKRGEFEKLATKAEQERDAARIEARTLRQSIALRDHLAESHPEYVSCAKYIAPLIPVDVEGDDLAKSVKDAAAQYVKDNPRQAKGRAGAPGELPGRQPSRPSDSRSPRQGSRMFVPDSTNGF